MLNNVKEQLLNDGFYESKPGHFCLDYSDFEHLSFDLEIRKDANDEDVMVVRMLKIVNPFYTVNEALDEKSKEFAEYLKVSYGLFFRNVSEFYELLTRLGYPTPSFKAVIEVKNEN